MKKIGKIWYTDKQYIEILENRIKELKEDYDILDRFDDKNIDDYKKLEEENKKLKESIVNIIKDESYLQLRINKAIEYIEEHSLNFNGECEIDLEVEEVKDLYKILKGEEND